MADDDHLLTACRSNQIPPLARGLLKNSLNRLGIGIRSTEYPPMKLAGDAADHFLVMLKVNSKINRIIGNDKITFDFS